MKKIKPLHSHPASLRRWNRSRPDTEAGIKPALPSEFCPLRIFR